MCSGELYARGWGTNVGDSSVESNGLIPSVKTFKNNGMKPRWSSRDAYILVHKVDSLNVRDDSEIDWKTLPDPNWNLWSAHTLQRRWLSMKRSVRGYEDMTHAEILDILRLKKLHSPGSRFRAVVSAEAVEDSDDMNDDGD